MVGRVAIRLTALALLCGLAGQARAAERVLSPLESGTTLRGARSSTAFLVTTGEAPRGADGPTVELVWRPSQVLDLAASSLTLEVNREPVATRRLTRAGAPDRGGWRRWRIPAPELQPGDHLVTVVVRLVVADDPCLRRHPQDAWLGLSGETAVRWHEQPTAPGEPGVASLIAGWRGEEVQIVPPEDAPTRPSAVAFVEAHGFLAGVGATPTLEPRSRTLVLSVDDTQAALADAPAAAVARATPAARRLTVRARTAPDLGGALAQLAVPEVRALCPATGRCLLAAPGAPGADPLEERDPAAVWRLRDAGYRQGWVARGAGTHALRFVWPRPAWWQVEDDTELVLKLRLPAASLRKAAVARLQVTVNERPMAQWELRADSDEVVLRSPIPEAVWETPAWAFEVEVRLQPAAAGAPCVAEDDGGHWVVVEPASRLLVSRRQPAGNGLNSWFEEVRGLRPPLLGPAPADWAAVERLALLLAPIASRAPGLRWRWHPSRPSTATHIIDVRSAEASPTGALRLTHARERRWWLDGSGVVSMPLVARSGAAHLALDERGELGEPWALVVHVGDAVADLAPPDYAQHPTALALFAEGRWHALRSGTSKVPLVKVARRATPEEAAAETLRSEREARRALLNLLWAAIAVATAVGLVWWTRRRPASQTAVGMSIEQMSPEETGA